MNQQTSGTIGGTLLTIVGVLDLQDIFKTIILAAIGALVSFIVSTGLKIIFKRSKKQKDDLHLQSKGDQSS